MGHEANRRPPSLTFLFLTSSPCRWLIWRKEPPALTALTGLTARTGLLRVLERPLTSTTVPSPKRAPLQMFPLLADKDVRRPSSGEVVPAVCRSAWDLTLRDIWSRAALRLVSAAGSGSAAASHPVFMSCETRADKPQRRSFQRRPDGPAGAGLQLEMTCGERFYTRLLFLIVLYVVQTKQKNRHFGVFF